MRDLKYKRLSGWLKRQKSVAVAFSGGVDSSVLAAASFMAIGNKALAVTLDSPTMARSELSNAKKVARAIGVRHLVVEGGELSSRKFRLNTKDRCYHCKRELARVLTGVAAKHGIKTVLEGTNADDLRGHRPGYKALRESRVFSPLAEFGFTKEDVRELARKFGLPVSEKPSTACLSSRISYGIRITRHKLAKVEKAEDFIKKLGVGQLRVRFHGNLARIEVSPKDFQIVLENKERVVAKLNKLGFKHVALDLSGYRAGSMN